MGIKFDEKKHEYRNDKGDLYISVTQLLKKYGLSVDYANIPDHVLANAAQKGKAVHKALEEYIKGDDTMIGLFDEVSLFDSYIKQRGLNRATMVPEEILYDDKYLIAGTVDVQYIDPVTSKKVIADFKTTSSLHIDAVTWQLSIYNYLISKGDLVTYYLNDIQAIHMYAGQMRVKDLPLIEFDAITALLSAQEQGATEFNYTKPDKILSNSKRQYITQLLNERDLLEDSLKSINAEIDELKTEIKTAMESEKEYKYDLDGYRINYIDSVVRTSLNRKRVQEFVEQHGGDMDKFYNTSKSNPDIRIFKIKSKDD